MFSTELRLRLYREANRNGIVIESFLKNAKVNKKARGCSGFVVRPYTGGCVYVNTGKAVLTPSGDKNLCRYAEKVGDFSSGGLVNGQNNFVTDAELAAKVIEMLKFNKGIPKEK